MIFQFIHFRCKLNFPLCLLFQLFIMWLFFFLVWDPLLIPGILYFTMVCFVLFFIYSAGYFMIPLSLKTHVFQPWGSLFDHFFLLFTLFFLSGSPIRCMMGHQAWSSGLLMFSLTVFFFYFQEISSAVFQPWLNIYSSYHIFNFYELFLVLWILFSK